MNEDKQMEQQVLPFIDQLNNIRSTVAAHHNAAAQGDVLITGAEVRQLIESLKALEAQCPSECFSLEEIEAIVVDDPADTEAAA